MEELFNGQLSFADIEAEQFLQIRRTHADRRVNAMDRLTDDVINELIQLCLPLYHIKANHGRPYTRLETMVRVHLLQVSLNLSDLEMESYLASDMVARSFCRGECQDFCVWGGYSRGSPTRLPFVFEMQYARPDAIAGAKVEGPARSAGGSSLAPAIARREAVGALAREV